MKILITGSSGMIGKNLLEHPEINEFDILSPSRNELNLLSYKNVEDYLKYHKPNLIIHLAGKVGGIEANIREPVHFLLENLDMGRNIIWAARNAGIRRIINLGSSCMYPRDAKNPLNEEDILKGELEPTNEGYALAKITVSRLCEYINREDSSFQYKTIIPCNLYGRWDKFDSNYSHMIPAVIKRLHEAKANDVRKIEIWGDGLARREFMYAEDMADCIIQSIKKFETLPTLMNVGFGYDFTVNDYYHTIAEVIGYKGSFVHNISKPAGMKQKVVNIYKQQEWGWHPKYTLKEGITKTYQFFLNHGGQIYV